MKIFVSLMGRKFIMAETAIITAFVFRATGLLDESGMVTLILGLAGLFFGANVIDKKNKKDTIE